MNQLAKKPFVQPLLFKNTQRGCLLHIGAPKTGSTALEKFLSLNRNTLTRFGWEYPDVSLRGFGHHDLAFLIGGGYPAWATPQDRPLDALLEDLFQEAADKERMILSSENFYLYPNPGKLEKILARAGFPAGTVKVIVYVRRQDDVHVSWYNQAVKAQGYTGSIIECINENIALWNYADRLKPWASVFGEENIVVRPHQPEDLSDGDICADFLRLAGLSPGNFDWPKDSTNTRINREILEFQILVNRLPLTVQEKRRFHKELIALTTATAHMNLFDDSPLLTAAQRKKILLSYADSNTRVAKTYLGRERLFNENITEDPSTRGTASGLTLEKVIYILGWILAKQP